MTSNSKSKSSKQLYQIIFTVYNQPSSYLDETFKAKLVTEIIGYLK